MFKCLKLSFSYHGLHTSDFTSGVCVADILVGGNGKVECACIIGRYTNVLSGDIGLSDDVLGVGEETESLCWCNC